jgi:hypothetical protein
MARSVSYRDAAIWSLTEAKRTLRGHCKSVAGDPKRPIWRRNRMSTFGSGGQNTQGRQLILRGARGRLRYSPRILFGILEIRLN